jgi:hypothetical protein
MSNRICNICTFNITLEYRLIAGGIYHLQRGCIYISRGRDAAMANISSGYTVLCGRVHSANAA